jgi:hypothetical protein
MTLPVLTTVDDVRAIVKYLKSRPTGATLGEMKAALKEQTLDPRKLKAYEFWGVLARDGDRFKLTSRGWDFARKPEAEPDTFRAVLDSTRPYRSVLEWAHYQNLDAVTTVDVGVHWHEHHPDALGTNNDTTIGYMAVSFFHLGQAAGLGKLTMGRHGQPTRLQLDKQAVREYVEQGPDARSGTEPARRPISSPEPEDAREMTTNGDRSEIADTRASEKLRVFISHGNNLGIVDQITTMLQLAEIESEVAEKEETTAIPVPEKVFNAMRRCNAGVIAVTVDETRKDEDGNYPLNENVLIEIGAAFVLYDRRVVLLWDKRLTVPSNLQGLYRCEFEGEELTWNTGMKLMKAIENFKKAFHASPLAQPEVKKVIALAH